MNSIDEFWKRKLAAYLHDPPTKAFDILNHESVADLVMKSIGLSDEVLESTIASQVKASDIWDAAAERFVFPKGKCAHDFAQDSRFIHPISSVEFEFPVNFSSSSQVVEEIVQTSIGGVDGHASWHEKFFLYWRRWLDNALQSQSPLGKGIPFLPADSRIPDHSIWIHNALASTIAGCVSDGTKRVELELLLFQFGPVQEFISQARSTRDLWSGSYLLSWLSATAMKAVTDCVGPDSIVFPSLRGNGIYDALHRDTFYAKKWKTGNSEETTWSRICKDKGEGLADWLLTPTLPNRFFAIVPKGRGHEFAQKAEGALRAELKNIADAVWAWLGQSGIDASWHSEFNRQVDAFPQISWAIQPWLKRDEVLSQCKRIAPAVATQLEMYLHVAEEVLPLDDRDSRYYSDTAKTKLNNDAILWSAHYALLSAKLATRRNTREFEQWDCKIEGAVKDSLSGKEECIGGEGFWRKLAENKLFSSAKTHRYGAMNLIKRIWCSVDGANYLSPALNLNNNTLEKALRYDSLEDVARAENDTYVAVLALDGDQMGKWISGELSPLFVDQLSPKAKAYLNDKVSNGLKRLLTPSYHLQISEALSNFAIFKARCVIEQFNGELIYAGGDDVLAVVPAKRAIACAQAVRESFRINFESGRIFPGSRCDMSCGLVVGHYKAPLQMLVKEAQRMEHRAKDVYGRSALAIALYKRSGEIIEWGCQWDAGAINLMNRITELSSGENAALSGRFPYALAAVLQPYALSGTNEEMLPIIKQEVRHVLAQQGSTMDVGLREQLAQQIDTYLNTTSKRLEDFIDLFLAETFINRMRGEA